MNKFLPFFLLAMTVIVSFKTDDGGIKTITEKLEKFRKDFPQEKVHLHFDKPVYSIGDTMYFKAYVVNAEKNMPTTISNILYVDMINENNANEQNIVLLPITDGVSEGSMVVSDTLQGGSYLLRAYTNWMRNFDEENFYHRNIIITDALNDEVQMRAHFKVDSLDGNKLIADITYSNIKENSFSNKEIKYAIMQDGKEIQKGKNNLDRNDNLKIDLSNLSKNQSYQLVTYLKEDKKTEITRRIQFNLPASSHSIQFFPEAGQMINGLQSCIGFKAVGLHGEGMDVSGTITDETGSQVAVFASSFAGMGRFTLTPEAGHTYTATIKYKNGYQQRLLLPKAANEGCAVTIENNNNENITLKIAAKGLDGNHVILITQCNNRIQYTQNIDLTNNIVNEQISTKKFPTGIIQFTIFDTSFRPLAERLVFVNQSDQLKIQVSDLKKTYQKREKVMLTFHVTDEEGKPAAGNFSVAVARSDIFPDDSKRTPTIVSDLLLTSDLKGYIENPNYYFSDVNEKKVKDLDNLMLIQGWRRFKWSEILSNQYLPINYVVEKDLRISGRILTDKHQPAAKAEVNIISKGGAGFTLSSETDVNGYFSFDNLDFTDDIPVVVQAMTADSSRNVIIEMSEFSMPAIKTNSYLNNAAVEPGDGIQNYLTQSHNKFDEWRKYGQIPANTKVLKEVKVNANPRLAKEQEAVQGSYNLNGPGHADQIFTYDDLRTYNDLTTFLPGRAVGITIKPYIDPKYAGSRDRHPTLQAYSSRGAGDPMRIILDGLPMEFTSFPLNSFPASNIQSIEILRSGSFTNAYGLDGSNGVIVITTKRGGIDYDHVETYIHEAPIRGMLLTNVKGYSEIREFYSPEHSETEINHSMKDLRSALYWKPVLKTDDDGNATIEFYNGDSEGRYDVTIEGITEDGQLGSASFSYKLK